MVDLCLACALPKYNPKKSKVKALSHLVAAAEQPVEQAKFSGTQGQGCCVFPSPWSAGNMPSSWGSLCVSSEELNLTGGYSLF